MRLASHNKNSRFWKCNLCYIFSSKFSYIDSEYIVFIKILKFFIANIKMKQSSHRCTYDFWIIELYRAFRTNYIFDSKPACCSENCSHISRVTDTIEDEGPSTILSCMSLRSFLFYYCDSVTIVFKRRDF